MRFWVNAHICLSMEVLMTLSAGNTNATSSTVKHVNTTDVAQVEENPITNELNESLSEIHNSPVSVSSSIDPQGEVTENGATSVYNNTIAAQDAFLFEKLLNALSSSIAPQHEVSENGAASACDTTIAAQDAFLFEQFLNTLENADKKALQDAGFTLLKSVCEANPLLDADTSKAAVAAAAPMAIAHAVEIALLLLSNHPVFRVGALILPYVANPMSEDTIKQGIQYNNPNPSAQYELSKIADPITSFVLWSIAQPACKVMFRALSPKAQIVAALTTTVLITGAKAACVHMNSKKSNEVSTAPSSTQSVEANIAAGATRSIPDTIRQFVLKFWGENDKKGTSIKETCKLLVLSVLGPGAVTSGGAIIKYKILDAMQADDSGGSKLEDLGSFDDLSDDLAAYISPALNHIINVLAESDTSTFSIDDQIDPEEAPARILAATINQLQQEAEEIKKSLDGLDFSDPYNFNTSTDDFMQRLDRAVDDEHSSAKVSRQSSISEESNQDQQSNYKSVSRPVSPSYYPNFNF